MLSLPRLLNMLDRVLKEIRRKYGEAYVEKIKEHRGKYVVNMRVADNRVKIIIYKNDKKTRVYANNLAGLEIALRKTILREYNKEMRMKSFDREKPL